MLNKLSSKNNKGHYAFTREHSNKMLSIEPEPIVKLCADFYTIFKV